MGKIFVTISLTLLSLCSFGQVTYTWRYYSVDLSDGRTGYYLIGMPSDSITSGKKKSMICYEPGAGETAGNTTLAKAILHGTARDVYNGEWDGGIRQSNGYTDSIVYPIYAVAQYSGGAASVITTSRIRWMQVLTDYSDYINTDEIHFASYSLGGRGELYKIANVGSSSGDPYTFAHMPASQFILAPGGKSTNITNNSFYIGEYVKKGGRVAITTGQNDVSGAYKPAELLPYFNDSIAGSAIGANFVAGSNGFAGDDHTCCVDTVFRHDHKFPWMNGLTIYEWMLTHTKAPKAIAQTTINTTGSSVTLNGVSNGWYKTVAWSKVSGPSATINSSSADTTSVDLTGGDGAYVFRMTVTNTSDSRTATWDVTVNRTAEPETPATFIKTRGRKVKIISD